jgi:protoheme IX farnesyltransferase
VLYALALIPASLLPALLGLSGSLYALFALSLGLAYLAAAVRFWFRADSPTARGLFRTSLIYLPLLLILLSFDSGSSRAAQPYGPGDDPAVALVGSR